MKHIKNYKIFENLHETMFHVSLCLNRDSILKNGLNSSGVTPWPEDKFPKGTYLFEDLKKARQYGFGNGDPFDIWKVKTNSYKLEIDPLTKNAFFIKEPIAIDDINILEKHEHDVTNPALKPVISYDFDGTLHKSVNGVHPLNFIEPDTWEPFLEVHEQLKEDAKNNKIIVVTARPPATNIYVWEFIKKYQLPVEDLFATNDEPKVPILVENKAIKHYDDYPGICPSLEKAGIEFVLVDPRKRTIKLIESLGNPMKNYVITFANDKFYVADNTLEAFVKRLKKIDSNLLYNSKENGKAKDSRMIYVKSSALTHEQIRNTISEFTPNYDYLKMVVVTK